MDNVHIGTMGWSYSFWVGSFYPPGLRPDEFLTEYSKHFETVEVNSTFYRIPSKDTLAKWKEQVPTGFLFTAKFPQILTHKKMLKNSEKELEIFLERIALLRDKVGPLLLQFPPAFGPKDVALLADFLPKLPNKHRYAVEVRNRRLLDDKLYSLLRKNGVALVINSLMPGTERVTADFVYIRWEGDRKKVMGTLGKVEIDRKEDLKRWAQTISKLLDETKEAFGYFSKYYSGHPPSDVTRLTEELEATA